MSSWSDPQVAHRILTSFTHWAVVGCSSNPARASFDVARFLTRQGYEVIPVNPNEQAVLGRTAYPDLRSVPDSAEVEVVDIFRRSEKAGFHVDEAIERGAKAVWMQLGVIDAAAAARADAAGLLVVMNRCPAIDHPQLVQQGRRI